MGMTILLYGFPILVGFVLGYFFTTAVVVIITVIAGIIAFAMRPKREQEIGALIGMIAWVIIGIGVTVMWGTHLYVTGTDIGIPSFFQYIFR